MSSINNVNNNNYVVNVGRTVPLTPGPQGADKSLPVVVSTDQTAIPVEEQNKIQSEVALSLLGIPRSEVALGIFADVNTYDVNPVEWSSSPSSHALLANTSRTSYTGTSGSQGWGIKHLPEESGALVEAPADETSVLTSKRFFRYQPGRVSSATFGVKNSLFPGNVTGEGIPDDPTKNPPIRKYGIFDKFDGYYWETRDRGQGDQFAVVRRTQSITRYNPLPFGNTVGTQLDDHALAGKPPATVSAEVNFYPTAVAYLDANRFSIADDAFAAAVALGGAIGSYLSGLSDVNREKCNRDMDFAIDAYINDLKWGGDAHSIVNATTYRTALLNNAAAEQALHDKLGLEIRTRLVSLSETAAANKIYTTVSNTGVSKWTINAVGGTQPNSGEIASIDYGSRNKIETIFSIYDKFLAYLVSESMSYVGDTDGVIKYKCLRDVKFIINGYANDLQFGGNASTIYNAKRYYFLTDARTLQVYTQTSGGTPAEIARHTFLKNLLTSNSQVIVTRSNSTTVNIDSVYTLFNLTSTQKTQLESLADIIIANFTTEYTGAVDFGDGAVHGDLVIFRDGLIMTHASVYDPTLLKPRLKTVARVNTTSNTLTLGTGELRIGQYVNYYNPEGDAVGLTDGKMYLVKSVSGTKSNIITLADPATPDDTVNITTAGTTNQIEVPVPFIFPDDYDSAINTAGTEFRKDGMFPYLYTSDGILPQSSTATTVGQIDTAIDINTSPSALKKQIDTLNLAYINWVRDHVDPRYYSVYEYRIPRSRFSGDSLDAETRTAVYSDNVAGNRAGSTYLVNGEATTQTSVWDLDFTKVTMLKVEFSWYGAVGALFLAYVPVGNGEARWVRVHHLRASNQLKIASLGNATLPITYLVYGGGSESRLGLTNASRENKNYDNSFSEYIVKYGASYYIDGGDRGTVRLYNHSSDTPTEIYGSRYTLTVDASNADLIDDPYYTVNSVPAGAPAISTFYIGAKVITGSPSDRGVEIIWVDGNNLYLNKPISADSTSTVDVIVDRPAIVFGLEAKENIVSGDGVEVRNRVQVYPTKLSVGSTGSSSSKLTLLKTPIFQNIDVTTSGSFTTTGETNLTETNLLTTSSSSYLPNNGDFVYGYFKGYLDDSNSFIKVLGKLEKTAEQYYFYPEEVFTGNLTIQSGATFLKEEIFDSEGTAISSDPDSVSKERLSSVRVSSIARAPIPGTGTRVSTYHISTGSYDFDLLSYFDYNKEYISFPLTDQVETLYLVSYSTQTNSESTLASIQASLTWEEQ